MRCKEFDAQIDEMIAGVEVPDASRHLRQCERCSTHFRARSAVYAGLRALAAAPAGGPSRATDRAVMESYRRLQRCRVVAAEAQKPGRVVAFPGRRKALGHGSHAYWGRLAVAVAVLAMVGSGFHLWSGAATVSAPTIATAPAASQSGPVASMASPPVAAAVTPSARPVTATELGSDTHHSSLHRLQARLSARSHHALRTLTEGSGQMLAVKSVPGPAMQPAAADSILHLASAESANAVAQSASSTWPGYSNLMYCDPVVCSGPMQVIHIRVPVKQVMPALGTSSSNGFVDAEVVVGPDGVARAIRIGN
jgi:hypothetical protein